MEYCNLGLDVSFAAGEALKLILAASFKTGLNWEVIFTFLVVSCAVAAIPANKKTVIRMENFIV